MKDQLKKIQRAEWFAMAAIFLSLSMVCCKLNTWNQISLWLDVIALALVFKGFLYRQRWTREDNDWKLVQEATRMGAQALHSLALAEAAADYWRQKDQPGADLARLQTRMGWNVEQYETARREYQEHKALFDQVNP